MARSPRLALAQALASEMRRREGRNLVAVAVYGSVAHGMERPHSDVDMLLVVRRRTRRPWARMRSGFLVTIKEMTPSEVWDEVAGANLNLAEILGGWRAMRPLYDPKGFVRRSMARANRVSPVQFRRAARDGLLTVYEDLGKLRDAIEEGDRAKMREMAIWFTRGAAALLCLLECHALSTGQELFVEVQRFGRTGREIAALRYRNPSIAETSRLAESIWRALCRDAHRQGLRVSHVR